SAVQGVQHSRVGAGTSAHQRTIERRSAAPATHMTAYRTPGSAPCMPIYGRVARPAPNGGSRVRTGTVVSTAIGPAPAGAAQTRSVLHPACPVPHVSVAPRPTAARSTGRAQPPGIVWVVGGICGTRDVSDAVALGE